MAVDRKQQMKEITERLEQGVKDIFTSEMYTTYPVSYTHLDVYKRQKLRSSPSRVQTLPSS